MKFSEVLKEYIQFKNSRKREGSISRQELSDLREAYENGAFDNETSLRENTSRTSRSLKERRADRIAEIRARIQEAKKKKKCSCDDEDCDDEDCDCKKNRKKEAIRQRIKARLAELKRERIKQAIREKIAARRRNARFQEDEFDAATGTGMDQGMDPNAQVDPNAQADPNAQPAGQFDPSQVASTVEQIKSALESLAAMLGVQENPMDANPDANIPPEGDVNMDGMADPNAQAAAPAPMPESMKRRVVRTVNYIRESLKDKRIYEAFKMKYPLALGSLFDLIDLTPRKVDKTDSPSMLANMPSTKTLVKGTDTSKDVVRWPNEKITAKDAKFNESLTEKLISDHIQRMDENWDFAEIIKKGVI